ncbi:hypothetical protein ACIQVO_31665 [Streptomyces sp. NPDC101062]|uniref:hypothetical protein n=1 Tax=unclassified Streptomyces TaxID=2593676 RepID=UPI002E781E4C|nr:hypothetical protein [Streptomyces sp. JV176]MEE1798668.1 hypothetical protein [Streptomyces sp. JV176]
MSVRTVRRGLRLAAALLATGLLLTGCAGGGGGVRDAGRAETADKAGTGSGSVAAAASGADKGGADKGGGAGTGASGPLEARGAEAREIPDLGPETRAQIPSDTRQAVVVTGINRDSNLASVVVHERDPVTGWEPVTDTWPAHNALEGWTDDHNQGDLRSPIGVYGLTDAGGRLADPGSRLPYDQGPAFSVTGTGFEGEPLEGSFDYVVAINYNRVPGNTPLDWTRPLGDDKGGGIWIHVDHGGPTQACVSVPLDRMKELLRTLDPEKKPVVVMGDADSLAL